MKLTCAIIDDEPLAASLLESYALKTPFLEYIECYILYQISSCNILY